MAYRCPLLLAHVVGTLRYSYDSNSFTTHVLQECSGRASGQWSPVWTSKSLIRSDPRAHPSQSLLNMRPSSPHFHSVQYTYRMLVVWGRASASTVLCCIGPGASQSRVVPVPCGVRAVGYSSSTGRRTATATGSSRSRRRWRCSRASTAASTRSSRAASSTCAPPALTVLYSRHTRTRTQYLSYRLELHSRCRRSLFDSSLSLRCVSSATSTSHPDSSGTVHCGGTRGAGRLGSTQRSECGPLLLRVPSVGTVEFGRDEFEFGRRRRSPLVYCYC